jgi:hypothetical protein
VVIFILGEGQGGIMRRLTAWGIEHKIDIKTAKLFLSLMPAALCDAAFSAEVVKAVDGIAVKHGAPLLIIIDTVQRNFGGGDENSAKDMGTFIHAADTLRSQYGACVLLVHHSGVADKGRGRGSSALRGALDCEFKLEKDDTCIVRIECSKMKDGPIAKPMAFELFQVGLPLRDEHGAVVTSAILSEIEWAPVEQKKEVGGKNKKLAMEILNHLYSEHIKNVALSCRDPKQAAVLEKDWKAACINAGMNGKSGFHYAKKTLLSQGLIKLESPYVFITD